MTPAELKAANLFLAANQAYSDGDELGAFNLAADARGILELYGCVTACPSLTIESRFNDWTLAKFKKVGRMNINLEK